MNCMCILAIAVCGTKFKWSNCFVTLWRRHLKMLKRKGYLGNKANSKAE